MDAPRGQVGPGELLQLRSSADTEGEVQRVLAKLEAAGIDLPVVRSIANAPNAFRPFILLADALLTKAVLPAPVREVVIMYLAARQGSAYEWHEHERMAAAVGVTRAQLQAILAGDPSAEHFSAEQLLGVAVAREMLDGDGLSRERWREAIDAWGVEGAMDVVLSVGWWGGMVPLVLGALALDAPPIPDGS